MKMRTKTRALSFLLVVVMLMGMIPLNATTVKAASSDQSATTTDEQKYFIQEMSLDITNDMAVGKKYASGQVSISGRQNDVKYYNSKSGYGVYKGSPIGKVFMEPFTDVYLAGKNGSYRLVKEGDTIQVGHYYAYSYLRTQYADITGSNLYGGVYFSENFKLNAFGAFGVKSLVYYNVTGIGEGYKNALRVEIPLCMYDVKPEIKSVTVNGTKVSDGSTIKLDNGNVELKVLWSKNVSDALAAHGCTLNRVIKKYVNGKLVSSTIKTVEADATTFSSTLTGSHTYEDIEYVTEMYVVWPDGYKDLVDRHTVMVETGYLNFALLSPEVSGAEKSNGYSDLGKVEYGTELDFGFAVKPLTQTLIDSGYNIKESITVSYEGHDTVLTRNSGSMFNLMQYVDEMGTYQINYNISLYKNSQCIMSKEFDYEVEIVTKEVDYLEATLTLPVPGELPSDTITNNTKDAYIYNVEWSYFNENTSNPDFQWVLMPDDMVFEGGKRYECTITFKPNEHCKFTDNSKDMSVRINGEKTSVVGNPYPYYTNKCYVEYEFYVPHNIDIGEVTLKNGECLWNGDSTPHTDLPDSGTGYIFYGNNTLIMCDYKNEEATIQFLSDKLEIHVLGNCGIGSIYDGSFYVGSENSDKVVPGDLIIHVYENSNLSIYGYAFDAYSSLRVFGDITIEGKGDVTITTATGNVYSAAVIDPNTFVVNGPDVTIVSTDDYAIFGPDSKSTIIVKDGTLVMLGIPCAIKNCNVEKGNVYVSQELTLEGLLAWDGIEELTNYPVVVVLIDEYKFEKQPVLGEEIEKGLYEVSWETTFIPVKTEIYKLCESTKETGYVLEAEVSGFEGYMYHLVEHGAYTDYFVRVYYNETEYVDSEPLRIKGSAGSIDITYVGLYVLNGNWVYLREGRIDTTYTGMAENKYGWWYVKDGMLDRTYTGMVEHGDEIWYVKAGKFTSAYVGMIVYDGKWIYVKNGKFDSTYTGMAKNSSGVWYMKNGVLDRTYTGMALYGGKWVYVNKGKYDNTYTGMAEYSSSWWYMKNGELDRTYTGMVEHGDEIWYVKAGKFTPTYTGMIVYDSKWIYVKNGKFDSTYTGMAQNSSGVWYMKDGVLDRTYTGMVLYGGKWVYVNKGKYDSTYTGMAKNSSGWWYMKDGTLDRTYTGMVAYGDELWYVKDGKFMSTYIGMLLYDSKWIYVNNGKYDGTYTGMAQNSSGWWYMKDGTLDRTYTGMVAYGEEIWYVKEGRFASTYTGMMTYNGEWIYVKDGKFDNTYTGAAQNKYGWWYMKNGKLDFSYNGSVVYEGNTYNVTNGKVAK